MSRAADAAGRRSANCFAYTLLHLQTLVVKPVAESGGYGLLIGPRASAAELDDFRNRLKANPERGGLAKQTLDCAACWQCASARALHGAYREPGTAGRCHQDIRA